MNATQIASETIYELEEQLEELEKDFQTPDTCSAISRCYQSIENLLNFIQKETMYKETT